jgi:Uma2 family endonuclease
VSIAGAWPSPGKPFTVAELDRMPDDGHRYELLDGALVVSPRPGNPHQEVAAELLGLLRSACPAAMRALPEPAVQVSQTTEFAPDLVVITREQVTAAKCTQPPLLVVEVRSPSTALIDLNAKKAAYERFGVPSYWVVIPDSGKPELIAFELRGGHYEEAARVSGDEPFRARRPFPVEVIPARLVSGLRPPPRDRRARP